MAATLKQYKKVFESFDDNDSVGLVTSRKFGIGSKTKKINRDQILINPTDKQLQREQASIIAACIRDTKEQQALVEKAQSSNIPLNIIETVYERGVISWFEQSDRSHPIQQYAFSRVASFINGGKAWKEDVDLHEAKKQWVSKTGHSSNYRNESMHEESPGADTERRRLLKLYAKIKRIGTAIKKDDSGNISVQENTNSYFTVRDHKGQVHYIGKNYKQAMAARAHYSTAKIHRHSKKGLGN